jgi:hypothetical protein
MAKDRKHTKLENWVLLQEIYAAELARLRSPVPTLRVVRNRLKRQPYRYFDCEGGRHENDLSDDFIANAEFHLDNSSATRSSAVVFSKDTLYRSVGEIKHASWLNGSTSFLLEDPDSLDLEFKLRSANRDAIAMRTDHALWVGDEPVARQAAEAPSKLPPKLPPPMLRRWKIDPNDLKSAVSYEEVVFSWEAYAIELLEAPAIVTSAPAPPPKRLSTKDMVVEEMKRRKDAGEPLILRGADLARDLVPVLAAQSKGRKPPNWRYIANIISDLGL